MLDIKQSGLLWDKEPWFILRRISPDRLFLSVKTVETYKAKVMKKLYLHGQVKLVRYAIQLRLLTTEK